MKNNKYRVMELFLYILIVIVGLVFLFMGKSKEPPTNDTITPPPTQTDVQHTERGKTNAVIFDRQGQSKSFRLCGE